jgi:hypothetical protein
VPPLPDPKGVFLNVPYDKEFSSLYVAYIVGLCQLGLVPHLASEIPGGDRRLNRIIQLIQSCRYSIHDLSRVELNVAPSATPRFNMPLELGMTITWQILNPDQHTWFVCESEPHRLQRSASDLNGTDPCIHDGTVEGVLRELRSAFHRDKMPSVPQMLTVYGLVNSALNSIFVANGTRNPYDRSVFKELCRLSLSLTTHFFPPGKPAV